MLLKQFMRALLLFSFGDKNTFFFIKYSFLRRNLDNFSVTLKEISCKIKLKS